jgi:hypothetical protein
MMGPCCMLIRDMRSQPTHIDVEQGEDRGGEEEAERHKVGRLAHRVLVLLARVILGPHGRRHGGRARVWQRPRIRSALMNRRDKTRASRGIQKWRWLCGITREVGWMR